MGLPGGGDDPPGEFGMCGVDAVSVGIGGRAANMLPGGQTRLALLHLFQAEQSVLEGVVVEEPGLVTARIPKSHSYIQMSILDRTRDQATGPANNVPRQCPTEPGQRG